MHNQRTEGKLDVSVYFRRFIKIKRVRIKSNELEIGEKQEKDGQREGLTTFSENYLTRQNMRFL